ncbi:MAG: hypothetical protein ACI3U8_08505 [Candidatus Onthomonas sp.]
MTKEKLCPWLALGMGGICLLFWRWIWAMIYDPATQLVSSGGLVGLFAVFLVLCALILILLIWPSLKGTPGLRPQSLPLVVLRVLSGVLSAASGILLIRSILPGFSPIPLVLGVLLVLNGGALAVLALDRKTDSSRYTSLLLFPVFTDCYWLVAFYHQYGSCPSWETYLWPILAGLLTAWSWLAYAGRVYRPRKWDLSRLLALLSVLVLCPGLAAPMSVEYQLSLASQLVWFWSVALEPIQDTAPIRKENTDV